MDEQHDKPGFRVTDRRRFTESGERREDERDEETPSSGASTPEASAAQAPPAASPAEHPGPAEDVSFSSFVFGLSVEALMLLGEVESPEERIERNLPAAKHVIDVLGILKAKTSGNLDQAEQGLLDSILYDLRMRYVKLVRGTT